VQAGRTDSSGTSWNTYADIPAFSSPTNAITYNYGTNPNAVATAALDGTEAQVISGNAQGTQVQVTLDGQFAYYQGQNSNQTADVYAVPLTATGDCESRRRGGVRVANGLDVRTHPVERDVHGNLGREFAFARKLLPFQIGRHQILGGKHAFVHARRRRENAAIVQPHGKVSFAGDDVFTIIHPSPSDTDFAAVLFFALRMAGQE
jgi:hypothetical protein